MPDASTDGKSNFFLEYSPDGRWLVFASKANGPLTQVWLTHIDENGNDTPPVMLERFVTPDRAAKIPEFVNIAPGQLTTIRIAEKIRQSTSTLPTRPN